MKRALDLFCKAGGMTQGLKDAGYDEVIGLDIEEQPNYCGDGFVQAEALEFLECLPQWLENGAIEFDLIHASPPCQAYSTTASLHDAQYPKLIERVRELLEATGRAYIIENVVGAPLRNPLMLCGSSFGLGVRRHRLFETSPMIALRPPCVHHLQPEPIDVTGTGGPGGRHRKPRSLQEAREAMGIDWMTRRELSEAIPPAYGEFIGSQLLAAAYSVEGTQTGGREMTYRYTWACLRCRYINAWTSSICANCFDPAGVEGTK